MQCSSRKCACQRELNSHDAAKPRISARRRTPPRGRQANARIEQPDFNRCQGERRPVHTHKAAATGGNWLQPRVSRTNVGTRTSEREGQYRSATRQLHEVEANECKQIGCNRASRATAGSPGQAPTVRFVLQGAQRHAKSLAGAADAEYRDCFCRSAERPSQWRSNKYMSVGMQRKLRPNPSLKRSANGTPPGPRCRYGVHFLHRGPGVEPLAPA